MSKYTTQEISEYFKNQGCELLGEYTGVYNKMKYKCKCGRLAITDWNNFKYGKRCGYCHSTGRKKKYTFKEVKQIFEEHGFTLLEKEYKDNKFLMRYICKCGREAKISLVAVLFQNQDCHACAVDKRRGPKNTSWREDQEQLALDKKFRKKCYKALQQTLLKCHKTKIGRTTDMLGYGPQELQEYITSHPNYERVKDQSWHLDHIFPIQAFLNHNIRDIKLINCLENLQPLLGSENDSKGDTYNKEKFLQWLRAKGINENI